MMLTRLLSSLHRTATPYGILVWFLSAHLVLLLMMTLTFPEINAMIETKAFDLQTFGYSFQDAQAILEKLEGPALDLYLFPQLLLLDVLYPFLLAMLLGTLIARLGRLNQTSERLLKWGVVIPFITMGCDYLENTCILVMITDTLPLTPEWVGMSSTFTQLKGGITTISWLIILVQFVIWGKNKIWSRKSIPSPSHHNGSSAQYVSTNT